MVLIKGGDDWRILIWNLNKNINAKFDIHLPRNIKAKNYSNIIALEWDNKDKKFFLALMIIKWSFTMLIRQKKILNKIFFQRGSFHKHSYLESSFIEVKTISELMKRELNFCLKSVLLNKPIMKLWRFVVFEILKVKIGILWLKKQIDQRFQPLMCLQSTRD